VKSNSSKAATVESANRYIRVLKETDAAQKAAIAELQKAIDEMRVRLGEKVESKEEKAASEAGATKSVVASPQALEQVEDPVAAEAISVDAVK
jgi:single-stranded DNA-specific DHH superfamily exonuclease